MLAALTPALAGALSGLLLFLSDYPVHAWPLQLVAFVPILVVLLRTTRRGAALAGLGLGLGNTLPLFFVLKFPVGAGLGLVLALTAFATALAVGAHAALRLPAPLGPLCAGAVWVVGEWASFTLLPIWGTAQSVARVWSAAPWAMQLVAVTGMTGLLFVLIAGQALACALVARPRAATAVALAAVVAVAVGTNAFLWRRSSAKTLRVAAVGWTQKDIPLPGDVWSVYGSLLHAAATAGARVVVSPEVGFWVQPEDREPFLRAMSELARANDALLVVGWFDGGEQRNRATFFSPDGATATYTKTHLIPMFETYEAGDGTLAAVEVEGAAVGAMICQDDNFTDLARAYGRRGVEVVAVPTNDWLQVKDYHLENSRFRPVENGYAIIRAASNGVSAIVSPRGETLARRDHFTQGPGAIVADVPLLSGGTPYSALGDWPAYASLALLAGATLGRLRRKR